MNAPELAKEDAEMNQIKVQMAEMAKIINNMQQAPNDPYFTKSELLQLISANVFSVLYYNSEIWQPSLKIELKNKLTSISARAIKTCMY